MQIPRISDVNQAAGPSGINDSVTPKSSVRPGGQSEIGGPSFSDLMTGLVEDTNDAFAVADKAMTELENGQAKDLNSVVMSTVKADLSFRFLLEMRNRITASYQELSRMQF